MDPIKEAFDKIKNEILLLKNEIKELNTKINNIKIPSPRIPHQSYQHTNNPTDNQTIPTHNTLQSYQHTNNPTDNQTIPTHNTPIQPLYTQNIAISTGNEGVPTNKPTNKQTNKPTQNTSNLDFKEVNNMLESLDSMKKEIRLKFKRLTPQEMLVFSTLYTLEEQGNNEVTYKSLAINLNLSESSIRDYINKLINKGIPIKKTRQNNKIIILNISKDLKNIATLTTIQTLKEL